MANLDKNTETNNSRNWFSQKHQNEIRFENEMKSYTPQLVSIIQGSFEGMKEEVSKLDIHYLCPQSFALRMHEQIRGKIYEEFEASQIDLTRCIWFKGNFACLFNKMDVSGHPYHNKTKEALRIINQGVMQHNGEKTVVHIGYVVNTGWTQLKKIYATGLSNGKIVWTIDLKEMASEHLRSIKLASLSPAADNDKPTVRAKKNSKLKKPVSNTGGTE